MQWSPLLNVAEKFISKQFLKGKSLSHCKFGRIESVSVSDQTWDFLSGVTKISENLKYDQVFWNDWIPKNRLSVKSHKSHPSHPDRKVSCRLWVIYFFSFLFLVAPSLYVITEVEPYFLNHWTFQKVTLVSFMRHLKQTQYVSSSVHTWRLGKY